MTKVETRSIRIPAELYNELSKLAEAMSDKEGIKPSLTVPQAINRLLIKYREAEKK